MPVEGTASAAGSRGSSVGHGLRQTTLLTRVVRDRRPALRRFIEGAFSDPSSAGWEEREQRQV